MKDLVRKTLNWRAWGYGLFSGVIGGGATAGSAWMGMSVAKSAGVDVPVLNLKSLGIILAAGSLTSALAYLKKSPLPPVDTITETVVESTQTETTTTTTTKP